MITAIPLIAAFFAGYLVRWIQEHSWISLRRAPTVKPPTMIDLTGKRARRRSPRSTPR